MDLFAGREPRKVISFHLDKEQTGQPPQQEDTEVEISDHNTARVLQHSQKSSESAELEIDRPTLMPNQSDNSIPGSTNTDAESTTPDEEPSFCIVLQIAEYQHEETGSHPRSIMCSSY